MAKNIINGVFPLVFNDNVVMIIYKKKNPSTIQSIEIYTQLCTVIHIYIYTYIYTHTYTHYIYVYKNYKIFFQYINDVLRTTHYVVWDVALHYS